MIKTIYSIGIVLGLSFATTAQVNTHAVGIRGGAGSYGGGAEISYQHGLGDAHRLELDLGWSLSLGLEHYSWIKLVY